MSFEARRQAEQLARFKASQVQREATPPVGLYIWADIGTTDSRNWGTLCFPPLYCADEAEVNQAVRSICDHYETGFNTWEYISPGARMTTLHCEPLIRIWVHAYRDARNL